tara:strand:+ start:101 stop:421 length:321 start_codon:yes stop_codon:yes gene_type:complete
MKYTKQIVFLLFINLVIVFLSIFVANFTRKLELTNFEIKKNIENEKEQLTINEIEYSFYNNNNYLKKLYNIYFSFEEDYPQKKMVRLSSITNINNHSVVLVNVETK